MLLRKERSHLEVYNDLDGEMVNLFRVLQNPAQAADLERLAKVTPFAREEFELAYIETGDPVERARRALIRALFGHGAVGIRRDRRTGFRAACDRIGRTPAVDWIDYGNGVLAQVTNRMMGVVIENRDALEVIAQQDGKETLFFVDPPYVHHTRGTKDGYTFEMSDEQHGQLVDSLLGVDGMVILCGYATPIYDRLGWEMRTHAERSNNAGERTEVLWLNPAAANAGSQRSLFDTRAYKANVKVE